MRQTLRPFFGILKISTNFWVSVEYILKQLFTSLLVQVVDIYLASLQLGKHPPLFTSTLVNNC